MNIAVKSDLVSAFIFNQRKSEDTRLLLLKRRLDSPFAPGAWQLLYGHLQQNENATEAIVRELHEETKLEAEAIYTSNEVFSFFNALDQSIYLVPVFVIFTDSSCVLDLRLEEHSAYQWVTIGQGKLLLPWHNQREVLEKIEQLLKSTEFDNLYRISEL